MHLIDTHTHLYLDEFLPDKEAAVTRAIEAGVEMMVFPNIDASTIAPMLELADRFPDNVRTAVGLHPSEVRHDWPRQLDIIEAELRGPRRHVAVGEIGIDLYWDRTFAAEQAEALRRQCALALELDLPVIIHCRQALDETLAVLRDFPGLRGVMHSFTGTPDDVERIRRDAPGFIFGINGIATFKNSSLRSTLPAIGLDSILLETDAPYLAPVPHRGRRNESAFIIHTAAAVAAALSVPLPALASATTSTARRLFSM